MPPLIPSLLLVFGGFAPALPQTAPARQSTSHVRVRTQEVTTPDVALSPDGSWLAFNLLGHIFRLPVEGGVAEQLTFGPHFDDDPAISPDGRSVAFVSDREGSQGGLFVLDLASGDVRRVAGDSWVDHPTWTPDGESILYIRRLGLRYLCRSGQAEVSRVRISDGVVEILSPHPDQYEAVAALEDGSTVWSVLQPEGFHSPDGRTSYLQRTNDGRLVDVGSVAGVAYGHRIVTFPGRVFVRRRPVPIRSAAMEHEEILAVDLQDGSEGWPLAGLAPAKGDCSPKTYRFDVSRDGSVVYSGEGSALWALETATGLRTKIPFQAEVDFERVAGSVRDLSSEPPIASSGRVTIYHPALSPDGSAVAFGALGRIWLQPRRDSEAVPISVENRSAAHPTFSPDGQRILFVSGALDGEELRIYDRTSGTTTTLIRGELLRQPEWSPDGTAVFVADYREFDGGYRVSRVPLSKPTLEEEVRVGGWRPRPQVISDGTQLLFSDGPGVVWILDLNTDADPREMAALEASDARLSPDGGLLAFRRNSELWLADVTAGAVDERTTRRLSRVGGRHFRFAPDGKAVVYSDGYSVWLHPTDGSPPAEVPIGLRVTGDMPKSLLVRNVRILDFTAGDFTLPTSFLVERGRIMEIGEHLRPSADTEVLDAGGRYAIPGLMEMHAHSGTLGGQAWRGALSFGVTSVRDLGSELYWMNSLAEQAALTSAPLPRLFAAGPMVEGDRGAYGDFHVRVRSPDEADMVLDDLERSRARFVKLYVTLSWDLHNRMARRATRLGIPIVTHGASMEEIVRCAIFLCASVEHSPLEMGGDLRALLSAAGVAWAPTATFGRTAYADYLRRFEEERLLTDRFLRLATPHDLRFLGRLNGVLPTTDTEGAAGRTEMMLLNAAKSGVRLVTGTDAGNVTTPVGPSVHWELLAMQNAGVNPLEALRAATLDAARVLSSGSDLGSLEVGKLADFVLLDADPLEDVSNTSKIWRVARGGWLFDPDELLPPRR